MKRIVLLGCAGSGKTTLARRLGERMGAPVICLDAVWRAGPGDTPRFRELMTEAHAAESWVSDGNFAQVTFDIRLPRADLIVWLETPRILCAARAILRVFRPGEAHRPHDLQKVLRFIWNFDRLNRPRIEAARIAYGPEAPVLHLRTRADVEALLTSTGQALVPSQ